MNTNPNSNTSSTPFKIVQFNEAAFLQHNNIDSLTDSLVQVRGFSNLNDFRHCCTIIQIHEDSQGKYIDSHHYYMLLRLWDSDNYKNQTLKKLLKNRKVLRVMTSKPEDIKALNDKLFRMISAGDPNPINSLLSDGADLGEVNKEGLTPMGLAVKLKKEAIIEKLYAYARRYIDKAYIGILSHGKIIMLLKQLGYKPSDLGTCFGIANVAMRYYLHNEMNDFWDMMSYIGLLNTHHIAVLANRATKTNESFTLGNGRQVSRSILDPFLNGVSLFQHRRAFEREFQIGRMTLFEMTTAGDRGPSGYITHIGSFSGCYDRDRLKELFLGLAGMDQGMFSLIFSSENHAININFDPNTQIWTVVDANLLPKIEIHHAEIDALMNLILNHSFKGSKFIKTGESGYFKAHLFSLNYQMRDLKAAIGELRVDNSALFEQNLDKNNLLLYYDLHSGCYANAYRLLLELKQDALKIKPEGMQYDFFESVLWAYDLLMVFLLAWDKLGVGSFSEKIDSQDLKVFIAKSSPVMVVSLINTYVANPSLESLVEYASKQSSPDLIKVIIDSQPDGFNIDECLEFRSSHKTPLMHSASNFSRDQDGFFTTRYLLDEGANPNIQNRHGCTALHFAAYAGNWKAIELLKERGADIRIEDNYGNTPKMLAEQRGYGPEVLVLL